jgi:hypothetical protein
LLDVAAVVEQMRLPALAEERHEVAAGAQRRVDVAIDDAEAGGVDRCLVAERTVHHVVHDSVSKSRG